MQFMLKEAYGPTTLQRNLNTSALKPFTHKPKMATRKLYKTKHGTSEFYVERTLSPYKV